MAQRGHGRFVVGWRRHCGWPPAVCVSELRLLLYARDWKIAALGNKLHCAQVCLSRCGTSEVVASNRRPAFPDHGAVVWNCMWGHAIVLSLGKPLPYSQMLLSLVSMII